MSVETPRSQGAEPLFYSEDDVTDYTAPALAFFKGTSKCIGCENPVSEIIILRNVTDEEVELRGVLTCRKFHNKSVAEFKWVSTLIMLSSVSNSWRHIFVSYLHSQGGLA